MASRLRSLLVFRWLITVFPLVPKTAQKGSSRRISRRILLGRTSQDGIWIHANAQRKTRFLACPSEQSNSQQANRQSLPSSRDRQFYNPASSALTPASAANSLWIHPKKVLFSGMTLSSKGNYEHEHHTLTFLLLAVSASPTPLVYLTTKAREHADDFGQLANKSQPHRFSFSRTSISDYRLEHLFGFGSSVYLSLYLVFTGCILLPSRMFTEGWIGMGLVGQAVS